MSLIDRYIVKEHIAPFIFGTGTVVFILLMQFLMISLGTLAGKGLSEWLIVKLIVYNMAWMAILAVPMGTLFSSLMTFGSMSMAHEVTIIKASGGSFFRMLSPVLFSSILLYIGLFYFNDVVLPESNHQVKIMMNDIERKKPTFALESGLFSTQLDGYTILARHVDSISGGLSGVTIYDMTKFQNRNIISSDSGWITFTPDYKKLVLDLKDGEIHQFLVNNVDNYKIIRFSDYRIAMNAYGFALEQSRPDMVSKSDREMNIADMNVIVSTAESNKNNIITRVDSVIEKTVTDIIFGFPPTVIDTSIHQAMDLKSSDSLLPNNKVPDSALQVAKVTQKANLSKEKPIKKAATDNDKSTSETKKPQKEKTLSFSEQVRAKYKAALEKGDTDLNSDTIQSEEAKKRIAETMMKEKKQLESQKEKDIVLSRASEKIIESKVKNTIKAIKIKPELNDNNSKDTVRRNDIDTAYSAVLNRVLQQVNLSKSVIQADVNNITFFENRSKQYRVEIYKKYALPFACVIFVLVGAPLGIITKGGNFGISAAISLVFYVFYWACLMGGEKLGDRGIVSPWLGMWAANIVVGFIGILLTIRVNNESLHFEFPFLKKSKKS